MKRPLSRRQLHIRALLGFPRREFLYRRTWPHQRFVNIPSNGQYFEHFSRWFDFHLANNNAPIVRSATSPGGYYHI